MQRRDFLLGAASAGIWLPLASTGVFARPLGSSIFSRSVSNPDRVLVLINLNGGNDGLNTVVPFNDQVYYDSRKTLVRKSEDLMPISPNLALPSLMADVHSYFDAGMCAIVQSVGYPDQDRSHFRSSDIWHSASNANQSLATGWTGRYIEAIHPEYPVTLPVAPYAIQVSSSTTLLIQGERGGTGMSIDNAKQFYDLTSGQTVNEDPLPTTLAGTQLKFIRQIMVESDIYSKAINIAINNSTTHATYGSDSLSMQLSAVARLINGGLGTGIYIVTLGGFDTHYSQLDPHNHLLASLSQGVASFMQDIDAGGNADRVVCMTYSEFGRRVRENGSGGTDHGAAAPQFVFGKPVAGRQIIGGAPDLANLDDRGDVKFVIDFRQLYSTLLQDWLGYDAEHTATLLGGTFPTLPLFGTPQPGAVERPIESLGSIVSLQPCFPNPAPTSTDFSFTTGRATDVRLTLYAMNGERVTTLLNDHMEPGVHHVTIDTKRLPNGEYDCVLEAGGERRSQMLEVMR